MTTAWEVSEIQILTEQVPDTLIGLLAAPCDTTYDHQLLPVEYLVYHPITADAQAVHVGLKLYDAVRTGVFLQGFDDLYDPFSVVDRNGA